MEYTEPGICNLALAKIGVAEFISALTDPGSNARTCRTLYAHARDIVLASTEWNFATRRAALALLTSPDPPAEWAYRYAYPSDCLVARRISDGQKIRAADQRITFQVEGPQDPAAASTQRSILTDQPEAVLEYTARIEQPQLYPPAVADAIAWKLAELIAMPLKKDERLVGVMRNGYVAAIVDAGAFVGGERIEQPRPTNRFTRARL